MKKSGKEVGKHAAEVEQSKEECYFTLLAEKALQTGLCCGEGREKSNGGYHPGYRNHCGQSKEGTAGDSLQEPGNFRRYRCLRIVVRSDGSLTHSAAAAPAFRAAVPQLFLPPMPARMKIFMRQKMLMHSLKRH